METKCSFSSSNIRLLISIHIVFFLLAACSTRYPDTCPSSNPVGLLHTEAIASDESLPFRFPLDESSLDRSLFFGWFGVSNECTPDIKDCYEYPTRKFHAAEDYKRPAGTPVYAMADGRISFSGRMGGYGWLTIIDHPQANLYSLYGHLSPSRWKLESGTDVKRGELIAYLGDSDENGGSADEPLEPHLHFGIRAGQTADYPGRGKWRFMAGWIRLCPQDLGWLQPSMIITNQEIPVGGYPQPKVSFLTRWGFELLITSSYSISGAVMIAIAMKKKLYFFLIVPGSIVITAGILLRHNGILTTYVLLVMGVALAAFGTFTYIRRSFPKQLAHT